MAGACCRRRLLRRDHRYLPAELQRAVGDAMVHVRRHGHAGRGLDAQGQRACPRRPALRLGERAHAHLDRPARRHILPAADVRPDDLFHLAVVHAVLGDQRGLEPGRRADPLAVQADGAGRLCADRPAGHLRNHQMRAGADAPATCANSPTRSRCNDRASDPLHGPADVRRADLLHGDRLSRQRSRSPRSACSSASSPSSSG